MTKLQVPVALKALLAGAAAFYAVFIGRSAFRAQGRLFFTLIDDAMISMRYAQHLAGGQGLVWNVGEAPVQGFTNLGWTIYFALLHRLPLSPGNISLAVMGTSAALLLVNALIVDRICRTVNPRSQYAPLMAAAVTAFYFPLVFWSLRGMEVGLLVVLMDLAILQSVRWSQADLRGSLLLGLILAAALLVRMDAAPQVAIILLYLIGTRKGGRGPLLVIVLAVGLAAASILAFQWAYFGDLLPNTYYQKMVGGSIIERLKNGVLVFNEYAARDVLTMALIAVAGLWIYRDLRSREAALLMGAFLVQCLYSFWVGGDYAEPEVAAANRFITQGMPALIILFSLSIDRLLADVFGRRLAEIGADLPSAPLISTVAASFTLLVISGTPWFSWAIDNAPLLKADIRRVRAGLAISENTSPAATIAVHAAGQIPYYSGRRAIDLLGLNDPVIAKGPRSTSIYPGHDKWNYDHSIAELKPDLIADNWIRLADYMKSRPDYRELQNGMYIRLGTTLVDEDGLVRDFP